MPTPNKYDRQLSLMLDQAGATEVRHKRHTIYRLPDGRAFPQPKTGSDRRGIRNAVCSLKNMLLTGNDLVKIEVMAPTAQLPPERRHRQVISRNWEANQRSGVIQFPTSDSRPAIVSPSFTSFGSLFDIRDDLHSLPGFWELSTPGRIRVLYKAIAATSKVDVIPTQFCTMSISEMKRWAAPFILGENRNDLFEMLIHRMKTTCDHYLHPGLLVHDQDGQDVIIDAAAMSTVTDDWDDILILDVASRDQKVMFADAPLWNDEVSPDIEFSALNPHRRIFLMGFNPRSAKEYGIHYLTDTHWADSKETKEVFRQLRALNELHQEN